MRFQGRQGDAITDLESWQRHGGPASAHQWADGRSAKCLAEAWLGGAGTELTALLASADGEGLDGFVPEVGVAEAQTSFDHYPGGKRNHDLLVIGQCRGGRTVVGIEGKADESFGPTIAEQLGAADTRVAGGERSNARARVEELLGTIGPAGLGEEAFARLRYQLFTAVAGTLAAAAEEEADQAVLCVQEFVTSKTDPAKRAANNADLRAFAQDVLGLSTPAEENWVVGPVRVPGSDRVPAAIPLWVGHLQTAP